MMYRYRSFMGIILLICAQAGSQIFASTPADLVTYYKGRYAKLLSSCYKPSNNACDYKKNIYEIRELIAHTADQQEKSLLYVALASTYIKDQQEEMAFGCFLQALTLVPKAETSPSEKEMSDFSELFLLSQDLKQNPEDHKNFQDKLVLALQNNPNYLYVQFLLATSLANQRQYDDFFYTFYPSYCSYPSSHMALKAKGLLAIKLYERAREPFDKEKNRMIAIGYLCEAMDKEPNDRAIHKMILLMSTIEEKKQRVHEILELVMQKNIMIPRLEVSFYIDQALQINDILLARALLDKAKEWHGYSRTLKEMQDMLDRRQNS